MHNLEVVALKLAELWPFWVFIIIVIITIILKVLFRSDYKNNHAQIFKPWFKRKLRVTQYKFYRIQNMVKSEFRFSQIMVNLNSDLAKFWLNLNSDLAKSGHRSYMFP